MKEQSRLRKQLRAGRRRGRGGGEEDAVLFEKMGRGESILPPRRGTPSPDPVPALEEGARDHDAATVVAVARDRVTVCRDAGPADGTGEATLRVPPALRARGVAVGDRVQYVLDGGEPPGRVLAIEPRRSVLSRPDPANPERERVIAANVDVGVIVVAVKDPPLRPGLVDRILVALDRGGVEPLVCANKIDRLGEGDPAIEEMLGVYEALDVPVVRVSALRGDGLEVLRAHLAGRACVFTGHSGVGKSALANRLDPHAGRATGAVSEHHGRGRHTTTGSALRVLADGTRLIDTPGVREFGLWRIGRDELARYFRELDEAAGRCCFRDCRHLEEPECAVRDAVERGQIDARRFDSYLRILGSIE